MNGWTVVSAVAGVVGLLIFLGTARSVVSVMLIPRPSSAIAGRLGRKTVGRLAWLLAARQREYRGQDRALSAVGPVAFLVNLVVIMSLFGVSFALMMYGVSPLTLADAAYQSGSTLLTLGFVESVTPLQVVVGFVASFTGLVVIAVFIGYLLTLYSAFTLREAKVTKAGLLAGEPAWGPELLCRRHLLISDAPLSPEREGWVDWVCQIRSSQSVYPILNFFRSPSPHRNWAVTLLAMMDAVNLQMSACDQQGGPGCSEFLAEGIQTFGVLRRNQRADDGERVAHTPLPHDPLPLLSPDTGTGLEQAVHKDFSRLIGTEGDDLMGTRPLQLTRAEFDDACDLMARSGVPLVADRDGAWQAFRRVRTKYEENAYWLTARIHAVPAPWSGPRRIPVDTIWPNLAAELQSPDTT